jgi:hypothetical protein
MADVPGLREDKRQSLTEGGSPKVASDQTGHGLGVSLEVYTSSDMDQMRAAVRKLETAVLRKPQPESQCASTNLA